MKKPLIIICLLIIASSNFAYAKSCDYDFILDNIMAVAKAYHRPAIECSRGLKSKMTDKKIANCEMVEKLNPTIDAVLKENQACLNPKSVEFNTWYKSNSSRYNFTILHLDNAIKAREELGSKYLEFKEIHVPNCDYRAIVSEISNNIRLYNRQVDGCETALNRKTILRDIMACEKANNLKPKINATIAENKVCLASDNIEFQKRYKSQKAYHDGNLFSIQGS